MACPDPRWTVPVPRFEVTQYGVRTQKRCCQSPPRIEGIDVEHVAAAHTRCGDRDRARPAPLLGPAGCTHVRANLQLQLGLRGLPPAPSGRGPDAVAYGASDRPWDDCRHHRRPGEDEWSAMGAFVGQRLCRSDPQYTVLAAALFLLLWFAVDRPAS